MINILKKIVSKAPVKVQEVSVEVIHNEIDTAQDRLLAQAMEILGNATHIEKVVDVSDRLKAIGFTNTPLVKRGQEEKEVLVKTQQEAELINYYSRTYPFLKFLTEQELYRICDKYDLIYAPVANYVRDVPEKNIQDIERAQPCQVKDTPTSNGGIVRVDVGSQWPHNMKNDLRRILDDGFYVPINIRCDSDRQVLGAAKEYGGYTGDYNGYVIAPHGSGQFIREDKTGLFIAAPKSHFDLTGLKNHNNQKGWHKVTITEIKDPIVFRYVRGGVQVLTKWGDEASDPALCLPQDN